MKQKNLSKFLKINFLNLFVFLLSLSLVNAQEIEENLGGNEVGVDEFGANVNDEVLSSKQIQDSVSAQDEAKLEDCFDYYAYGNVKVYTNTEKSIYQKGEKIKIVGQIVNHNTFPISDLTIMAQLKRTNQDVESEKNNHHYLIENNFFTKEKINILAGEAKDFDYEFKLDNDLLFGEYQIHYYVFTSQGFHYSGRAFLERDMAGITVINYHNPTQTTQAYFDINNFKVDNNLQALAKQPFNIFQTNALSFSVPILNDTGINNLKIKAKLYSFESTFNELLLEEKNLTVVNNLATANFNFDKNGAYVVKFDLDKPNQSQLKFRFTIESEALPNDLTLRINDLNITSYPLNDLSQVKAYTCFHSPLSLANTKPTDLTLQVLDKNKNVVDQIKNTNQFPPDVLAISLPLTKLTTPNDFYLKSITKDKDKTDEKLVHFTNQTFRDSPAGFVLEPQEGGKVRIYAYNHNKEKLKSGFIESLKIRDEKTDKIFFEKYVIEEFPQEFDLSDLPNGDFKAIIVSGNSVIDKKVNVVDGEILIDGQQPELKEMKSDSKLMLILIAGLSLLAFIFVFIKYRK